MFSVSGRTREFGIRLALGAQPQTLFKSVIAEGAVMAAAGIVAGGILGYILARLAGSHVVDMRMPDLAPVLASAGVLLAAALIGSFLPAARSDAFIDVNGSAAIWMKQLSLPGSGLRRARQRPAASNRPQKCILADSTRVGSVSI